MFDWGVSVTWCSVYLSFLAGFDSADLICFHLFDLYF